MDNSKTLLKAKMQMSENLLLLAISHGRGPGRGRTWIFGFQTIAGLGDTWIFPALHCFDSAFHKTLRKLLLYSLHLYDWSFKLAFFVA